MDPLPPPIQWALETLIFSTRIVLRVVLELLLRPPEWRKPLRSYLRHHFLPPWSRTPSPLSPRLRLLLCLRVLARSGKTTVTMGTTIACGEARATYPRLRGSNLRIWEASPLRPKQAGSPVARVAPVCINCCSSSMNLEGIPPRIRAYQPIAHFL